jgi:hypothetical protein
VERELSARLIVGGQLGAGDVRPRKVAAQRVRQITHGGHLDEPRTALGARFGDHHGQQRAQVRLDGDAVCNHRLGGLRRLAVARSAAPDAARGAMDEHDAADQIHVINGERGDFACSQVEEGGEREQPAPAHGHALAGHERRELARVEPGLRALHAAVRPGDAIGGVVGADAKRSILRAHRVTAGRLEDGPGIDRGLGPDLTRAHGFVQAFHHAFRRITAKGAHGQVTQDRADPLLPPARRLFRDDDAAHDAIGGPAL